MRRICTCEDSRCPAIVTQGDAEHEDDLRSALRVRLKHPQKSLIMFTVLYYFLQLLGLKADVFH